MLTWTGIQKLLKQNDRVTSLQETKKLLETISELKKAASTDFARQQVQWNWEVTFGIYAIWLLISGHLFAFCFIWSVAGEVLVRFGFVGLV